ncbi:MAG TPA: RNA 2',3'-cyclic phosphodiesterase [Verrucomicrobiae bacterium]
MPDPGSPSTYRLFVALPVPEQVKAKIVEAQLLLRRCLPTPAARWTRPEQFHLTLRFLGNVDASRTDALIDALRAACHAFGSLRLRAAGIGFFPNPRAPRVIWVGLTDEQDRLAVLAESVVSATNNFTNEEPEARFRGHITLARIKSIRPRETEPLIAAATEAGWATFGEWTATAVELIRSELCSQGARYTTLATIPL